MIKEIEEIPTAVIVLFTFFFLFIMLIGIGTCWKGRIYQTESFERIKQLKENTIDSVSFKRIDLKLSTEKIIVKDTSYINMLVRTYKKSIRRSKDSGRLLGKKFEIDFYKGNLIVVSSLVFVNRYSAILFVKTSTNEDKYGSENTLSNQRLKVILDDFSNN